MYSLTIQRNIGDRKPITLRVPVLYPLGSMAKLTLEIEGAEPAYAWGFVARCEPCAEAPRAKTEANA